MKNHLSISYNINGLGYQFINNKLGSDGYIYDNVIKYNTNCLINCNEKCNGIGYTKNIATFNNIYTSEFSENIFDDYNLNYYMIQIGNMVFYIDNGSILDVLINEENFFIFLQVKEQLFLIHLVIVQQDIQMDGKQ